MVAQRRTNQIDLTPERVRAAVVSIVHLAGVWERALQKSANRYRVDAEVRQHDEAALRELIAIMDHHAAELPLGRSGANVVRPRDLALVSTRDAVAEIFAGVRRRNISSDDAVTQIAELLQAVGETARVDLIRGRLERVADDTRSSRDLAGELVGTAVGRSARSIEHGAALLRQLNVNAPTDAAMWTALRGGGFGRMGLVVYLLRVLGFTEQQIEAVREAILPPKRPKGPMPSSE